MENLKFLISCVIFLILSIASVFTSFSGQDQLPFCGSFDSIQLILVSTLDGKITALDPQNNGKPKWTVHPGRESLLSSSIHRLELTNYGQLVRMIPSLSGGLYKFNGETVEPIPLSAEHLLQASFRYSDDLVISGGKESRTLGVSLHSGEVIYECSMKGCTEDWGDSAGDLLLVQRTGQIVRAVEPRSGTERWNFSVAQHDVKLLSECHSLDTLPRLNLKVIVPEGVVCQVNSKDSSEVLWKYKFGSPVVGVWEVQRGKIFGIDLFSGTTEIGNSNPSLYVGMHDQQLYIQESIAMIERRKQLSMDVGKNLIAHETGQNSLPWRPVIANAKNAGLKEDDFSLTDSAVEEASTTSLSVLYASPFVGGLGFYLYNKDAVELAERAHCNVTSVDPNETEDEEGETPVTVVIVSLWYWWREVAVISITTAIIFNLVFTRRYLRFRGERSILPLCDPPPSQSDSGVVVDEGRKLSESQSSEYESRYLTDFDPVHCLGKGGFGVVFEAKNKIDDCHYAIKRIVLPDAPESRERVMREVRTLAKLEHQNIVRYFNSWLESPPPGWQKIQDFRIIDNADFSDLATETATSCYPPVFSGSNCRNSGRGCSDSSGQAHSSEETSDSFICFVSRSENSDKNHNMSEHSIVIEESSCSRELPARSRRRKKKNPDWVESSSICQSPRKVYLYIQMQLCKKESLKDWLEQNLERNYSLVMDMFEQIVRAVDYVHYHNLIHRDLKPSNIFFSMDQQIKVGDFGLVTTIAEGGQSNSEGGDDVKRHTSQVGTQLYMSPEQLSGKPYSFKVDIFSLGLILFELLVPFHTQMERLKLLQDAKNRKYSEYFVNKYEIEHQLLQTMLSSDPDERPSANQILSVPPLRQINCDPKIPFRPSANVGQ